MKKRKNKIKFKMNSWIYTVTVLTFFITIVVSFITSALMGNTGLIIAIFVVLLIILIGIFFDTVGIAVTAGKKEPFHSMAACKVPSAKYSLMLLNNASQVSNFLNDVIGDISGIISGAASAVIVTKILVLEISFLNKSLTTVLLSSLVACLTVGGKAIGKEIALTHDKDIITYAGKVMYFINEKTVFKVFKNI